MEGVLLAVGTGALAGASAFVALSGDVAVRSPGLLTRAAVRRGTTALRRIGQTRLVGWVLSTGPGGRLAAEVASAPVPTVLGLGPSESAAAVSCGVLLASLASGVLLGSPLAGLVSAAALVALVVARDASARQRLRREVLGEMPGCTGPSRWQWPPARRWHRRSSTWVARAGSGGVGLCEDVPSPAVRRGHGGGGEAARGRARRARGGAPRRRARDFAPDREPPSGPPAALRAPGRATGGVREAPHGQDGTGEAFREDRLPAARGDGGGPHARLA